MAQPSLAQLEEGAFIDAGGYKTHYHDVGEGPVVLLLHGSGPGVSSWANWHRNIPALAESFRVLALDLVGWGLSERPADLRYGTKTWVEHARAFLDALEVPAAHVVGNSMGGAVALRLAIRYPERVRRLVMMGSGFVTPSDAPLLANPALAAVRGYTPSVDNMRHVLEWFAYDPALVSDEMVQQRYEASAAPGVQETYYAMTHDRDRSGNEYRATEDEVRAVQAPTLVLHGREDQVVPCELSWRLLQLLPDAELHIASQCGHWFQIEQSERFNVLLTEFCSRSD